MWNEAAGTHVLKPTPDAFDDSRLTLDKIGDRFTRNVGFGPLALHRQTPEPLLHLRRKSYRQCGAAGHVDSFSQIATCTCYTYDTIVQSGSRRRIRFNPPPADAGLAPGS